MSRPAPWTLYIFKVSVLIIIGFIYFAFPAFGEFAAKGFAAIHEHNLDKFKLLILSYGAWAPVTTIALMIIQSLVPFVPGVVLTIANAWLFGWAWGACYSWLGAIIGAGLDFGIARWYGRPLVEKIVSTRYLDLMNHFFCSYGIAAIALARLTPVVPYKIVSYGAGITHLSAGQYLAATAVGQTPALLLYSYLGQNITRSFHVTILITSLFALIFAILYYYRKAIERYFFQKDGENTE